jgi:hypothetical protein
MIIFSIKSLKKGVIRTATALPLRTLRRPLVNQRVDDSVQRAAPLPNAIVPGARGRAEHLGVFFRCVREDHVRVVVRPGVLVVAPVLIEWIEDPGVDCVAACGKRGDLSCLELPLICFELLTVICQDRLGTTKH